MADFSGFLAADELYDGPFCILSIVDNRTFKRLAYQVLSHAPTAKDVETFFRRFQRALEVRGLSVRGVTTDGSSLYPEPIAAVFGAVPHQVCTFHVLRKLTGAVLGAVAKVRKERTAGKPKLPRGRPTKAARRLARRKKRIEQKVGALFEHRYLFVQRRLSPGERRTLLRVTRGLPQLRVLRELMEEVYRLFDRRCRTDTALAKLAKLRSRLRRFGRLRVALKKLLAPGLEKALVFLDERLLGATSNAVERGNRRYRKMQKTVYRVRTHRAIEGRLALDLQRERQGDGRAETRRLTPCTRHGPREKDGPISLLQSLKGWQKTAVSGLSFHEQFESTQSRSQRSSCLRKSSYALLRAGPIRGLVLLDQPKYTTLLDLPLNGLTVRETRSIFPSSLSTYIVSMRFWDRSVPRHGGGGSLRRE